MEDESKRELVPDEELAEVSGGGEYFVATDDHHFEYWYICPACGEYRELILSGNPDFHFHLQGTFSCPKCGCTREYSLHT